MRVMISSYTGKADNSLFQGHATPLVHQLNRVSFHSNLPTVPSQPARHIYNKKKLN